MKLAVIDFNRTIYDPEADAEVPGASALLSQLRDMNIALVLVSLNETQRAATLERLGLSTYFSDIRFVDEKTPELFKSILREHGVTPAEALVVGDHPHDIACGTEAGMRTMRLRRGKFAAEISPHEPWRTVEHLDEISELILQL